MTGSSQLNSSEDGRGRHRLSPNTSEREAKEAKRSTSLATKCSQYPPRLPKHFFGTQQSSAFARHVVGEVRLFADRTSNGFPGE